MIHSRTKNECVRCSQYSIRPTRMNRWTMWKKRTVSWRITAGKLNWAPKKKNLKRFSASSASSIPTRQSLSTCSMTWWKRMKKTPRLSSLTANRLIWTNSLAVKICSSGRILLIRKRHRSSAKMGRKLSMQMKWMKRMKRMSSVK